MGATSTFGDPEFFNGPTHDMRIPERMKQDFPAHDAFREVVASPSIPDLFPTHPIKTVYC